MQIGIDTFTDADWRQLLQHSGESGQIWRNHPAYGASSVDVIRCYIYGNRVLFRNYGAMYFDTGAPASADYYVEASYTIKTDISNTAIAGRMSTSANTYYYTYYLNSELVLAKSVAGAVSTVGVWQASLGAGTYTIRLTMAGATIEVSVDGVTRISETDSSITAAGRGGIRAATISDWNTGKHIDNFRVVDGSSAAVGRSQSLGIIGV